MADTNGSTNTDNSSTEETKVKDTVDGDNVKTEETQAADTTPVVEMNPELRAKKIKRQIEYYFGDFNLPTDKFLREEVKVKEGWVPLQTLLKFKRLATLTQDPAVIVEALTGSELIQVNEDKTEIRRNPDKPLPEESEARRKEVMTRTVYVKGFPTENFTIDSALDYFEEYGPTDDIVMRFWQDKATKTWNFKGSVFVKFPTREAAAAFLAREEVKFGDTVLERKFQEEYVENKRKERLEQKEQRLKRKLPESVKEEKEEKGLAKDATLHMTNIPDGLARETIKEHLEGLGLMVAFIDYNKGDSEGWIRMFEEGSAAKVMKECEGGLMKLKEGVEITLKPLEGEEEEKFLESARKSILDRRNKSNNRGRGGRRGGRGGRGRGGWRGRKHDASGEPRSKAVKTEFDDDDD